MYWESEERQLLLYSSKKENNQNNNLFELSPTVLWKANLDLASDKAGLLAEELGKPSIVGISCFLLAGGGAEVVSE